MFWKSKHGRRCTFFGFLGSKWGFWGQKCSRRRVFEIWFFKNQGLRAINFARPKNWFWKGQFWGRACRPLSSTVFVDFLPTPKFFYSNFCVFRKTHFCVFRPKIAQKAIFGRPSAPEETGRVWRLTSSISFINFIFINFIFEIYFQKLKFYEN